MDYEDPKYQAAVQEWAKRHESMRLHNFVDDFHREESRRQEFSPAELYEMGCPLGFGKGEDYA